MDFFLYDSSKMGQVRNFATSSTIRVMVVIVGAINKKDVNNLYKDSEKTGGEKPIDLIKATRPIVIVDEPQSVDGGLTGTSKTALDFIDAVERYRYYDADGKPAKGDYARIFEVNRLTVIAAESYEQFAENLQKEIEAETGIRFGVLEQHQFASIAVTASDGTLSPLGVDLSTALWDHLKAAGHVDAKGKVQDSLRLILKNGTLSLPETFEAQRGQIAEILRKVSGRFEVRNADERWAAPLRKDKNGKAVYLSDDFKALWSRIRHQTTYRVQFDNAKLLQDCIAGMKKSPPVAKARLQWRKADIAIGKAGVQATEKKVPPRRCWTRRTSSCQTC